jgi:hypothetical protein
MLNNKRSDEHKKKMNKSQVHKIPCQRLPEDDDLGTTIDLGEERDAETVNVREYLEQHQTHTSITGSPKNLKREEFSAKRGWNNE